MIVTDASVLVPALVDDGHDGYRARRRLADERLTAPYVVDLEVVAVLRRLVRQGHVSVGRATTALRSLTALDLRRVEHIGLLERCWELRENVSAYDAAYVALAEARGAVLVTADERLARAPGVRCEVEVLPSV